MGVDFKTTYLQNHFEDLRQTFGFARNHVQELNPLWRSAVRKKDYTFLMAGWVAEALLQEELDRKRIFRYQDAAIWRLIVVGLNARRHGVGMPVITVRF